ncbi:HIT domain-containing protein [PVC group bacterium]|nr:HIT domain-containing protein [PVC group bacterium]
MDRLWTPWRMEYIVDDKKEEGCVFCAAFESKEDAKNTVLVRREKSFLVLNRYPYSNGHLLAVPNRHVSGLIDLDHLELLDLFLGVREAQCICQKALNPHGFNIGINIGAVAGAGLPGHLHVHIVPRWQGDSNFMPVVGKTKVLPETLASSYKKLLQKISG